MDRFRWIAAGTCIFLLIFLAVADTLGRLYVDPEFKVSEVIFGSIGGILLGVLGIEGVSFLKKRSNGDG